MEIYNLVSQILTESEDKTDDKTKKRIKLYAQSGMLAGGAHGIYTGIKEHNTWRLAIKEFKKRFFATGRTYSDWEEFMKSRWYIRTKKLYHHNLIKGISVSVLIAILVTAAQAFLNESQRRKEEADKIKKQKNKQKK